MAQGKVTGGGWPCGAMRAAAIAMSIALLTPVCSAASAATVRSEMLVSTAWLAEHLHDADVVVLCICAKESFCAGEHIPGARVIELSELVTAHDGIPNELRSPE